MNINIIKVFQLGVALSVLATASAQAVLIEGSFSGTVTQSTDFDSYDGTGFFGGTGGTGGQIGKTITASFSYDTALLTSSGAAGYPTYAGSSGWFDLTMSLDGKSWGGGASSGSVSVYDSATNLFAGDMNDRFQLSATGSSSTSFSDGYAGSGYTLNASIWDSISNFISGNSTVQEFSWDGSTVSPLQRKGDYSFNSSEYRSGTAVEYSYILGDFLIDSLSLNILDSTPPPVEPPPVEPPPPGTTPEDPVLPDGDGKMVFTVTDPDTWTFGDPELAIGYDYILDSGPNFASVLLPTGYGDDLFDLLLFDETIGDYVDYGIDLIGGVGYDFGGAGVDRFRIMGIEESAMLDPLDPTAFVTGMKFVSAGDVSMRQVAVTTTVPEPTSIALLGLGLAGFGYSRRRRKV